MPDLIVNYPDRSPDTFPLGRLRITIGRSARNDVCIPDPFASRVHAEVRREGDAYILQDLGSANGTLYNGDRVEAALPLTPGGRIQIGETEIVFRDKDAGAGATMIADPSAASLPEATIALNSDQRSTSGLLEAIEDARTQGSAEQPRPAAGTIINATRAASANSVQQSDLLALISKVSVTLLAPATLDETLRQVVALVFEAVPAERCLIMLRDAQKELKIRVAQLRNSTEETGEVRVSRSIIEEVVGQGRSVLTSDAQHDPRFMSSTMTIQGIRSVLAVPLGVGERIFGMIYADSPLAEAKFSQDHLTVLTTLASVAAIRVENARLMEEDLERERFERELNLAREIQQRFQPSSAPNVLGYEMQGISFPCYEIGGDYYDFIERPDGRMVIALGDVSGKGTSAALLMSSLHAAMHAQIPAHKTLGDTISAVNRYLAETIPMNRFITLFCAELDPATGSLSFLNAGHNPPLIAHAGGSMEQLAAGGIPLGIVADAVYREGRTQLQPGDALVVYSDGVSETQNAAGEEYGPVRLYNTVARYLESTAAGIRDKIEADLTKFAQGTPAGDDITLVIVKRQAEGVMVAASRA
ncbi:MAG: phosphoserine phosphatase RsbU/P [Pyrinomonadaceae bacterium]|jgi:serine phosphatase RsbU (regulator of sigma subunit)/pSer/pThr/pTyr-binding forkhead associated (FHA) protein|nr:phosphoserine phosphatase RsbU/P [Pyrinomonadaceae bacterium]MDX6268929.1 phosphoserine phosphatase RsbU/P [Acidobacteriota bacterium]